METPVSKAKAAQSIEDFRNSSFEGRYDSFLTTLKDVSSLPSQRLQAQYEEQWDLRKNFIINEETPVVVPPFEQNSESMIDELPTLTPFIQRLKFFKPGIVENARQKWGNFEGSGAPKYIESIEDAPCEELCYMVGVVYTDQPLKSETLDSFIKEHWVVAPPPRNINSEVANIFLEDESGQVELTGNTLKGVTLISGVVIGVLGIQNNPGEIEILDLCFPKCVAQEALEIHQSQEPKYVALISGLNIGEDKASSLSLELLKDHLCGQLGSIQEQNFSSHIVRVIFVGNSLAKLQREEVENKAKTKIQGQSIFDGKPVKELDMFLEEICESLTVDLMPGAHDPANAILPQQPMHFAFFERAQRFFTFNSVTNPHCFKLDGVTFLGNSGQILDSLLQLSNIHHRLQIAVQTMKWRLMDPTEIPPENSASDPFIIRDCPHVYFFGNQPQFETTLIHGSEGQVTRLVLLPAFSETHTIVLVNLNTLECHPIKFEHWLED
ncbi:DNA polymerase delta small subunit Cdc1 [Basidiobolus ranarum]|uniref:DNA polymerase delta small subunit Cdc1 n=1 Tax=Basidiobolus ranarum TaxID=34480 RepID=A0ABR2X2R1_9FUNG